LDINPISKSNLLLFKQFEILFKQYSNSIWILPNAIMHITGSKLYESWQSQLIGNAKLKPQKYIAGVDFA
jgi:hypothetical protein